MLDKRHEQNWQQVESPANPHTQYTDISDTLAQSILDSVDVIMAILDANGNIRMVNEIWRQKAQASCSPEQMERTGNGMNYLEVCRQAHEPCAEEAPEVLAGIEAVLQGKQASFTLEYPCASPTRMNWYMMRVTPLPQKSGAVVAHIDITERKEIEQQKDLFISIASHELQTPLTALKGLVQLEKKQRDKQGLSETGDRLTKMEMQINRLTKLATELLDVAKMQAGSFDYIEEQMDLDALISEIVETTQQTDSSHRLLVHGKTSATIMGDRDKLTQVFTNLLSNATKYSPQADQVDLYLEHSQERAFVRIQDYGIGIPKEYQSQLFERFSRIDASKHRFIPGLGMGLYIVREILNHHGGTTTIESEEGKGSTFSVSLPLCSEGEMSIMSDGINNVRAEANPDAGNAYGTNNEFSLTS